MPTFNSTSAKINETFIVYISKEVHGYESVIWMNID